MFVNLKKSIQYLLTHILPEVITYVLNVVVPIPLALSSLQILACELGFDLVASISFAFELPENSVGLMKTPPRKPVTEESKMLLKKREAERQSRILKGEGVDPESKDSTKPSLLSKVSFAAKQPFSKFFWSEMFRKPDGEVLVDFGVLSWSYLEIGLIESIGCFVTFFAVLNFGWTSTNPQFGITLEDSRYLQSVQAFSQAQSSSYVLNSGIIVCFL